MTAASTEKSTTVRTQLPPGPAGRPVGRRCCWTASPRSSWPAGRSALWCTPARPKDRRGDPRRHRLPHRHDRRPGLGRRTDRLPGARLGRPPRAAAVARRAPGRRRPAGRRLRRARARRLRARRARGPTHDAAERCRRALDTVIAAHGPARAVVGHSMGAAASALAVLDGTAHGAPGPGHPAGRPDHLHRGLRAHPRLQRADPAPVRGPHAGRSRTAGWRTSTSRCARPTRDGRCRPRSC